jgi:hypothetical protein
MKILEILEKMDLMDSFTINIFHWRLLIILIVLLTIICVVGCIIFIICSYYLIKWVNIDYDSLFYYEYNKNNKLLLEKYGDCHITKIYLVKEPIGIFVTFVINFITLYNYDKIMKQNSCSAIPNHTSLIFEINQPNKMKKYILIEKNSCINITTNININDHQNIKHINISKQKLTVNNILTKTQNRIGKHTFFNWHIFKNNCQNFTKEILITIDKLNKNNKNFVFQEEISDMLYFSDFTMHIINSIINLNKFVINLYNM